MAHITWVLKTHRPTEARALSELLSGENRGFRGEAFRVWMEAEFGSEKLALSGSALTVLHFHIPLLALGPACDLNYFTVYTDC